MAFRKWFGSKKKDDKNNASVTLSDIIRGIQFCVNSAYDIVEQRYLDMTERFFDVEGKPRTRVYRVNEQYAMEVPDFVMTGHNSLEIDEMTVKMAVDVSDLRLKTTGADSTDAETLMITRSCFDVNLGKKPNADSTHMDIEIKFKTGNPPEAICRMVDELNNNGVKKR